MNKILDGKKIADKLAYKIKLRLEIRKAKNLHIPHLAIILLGENASSLAYVNNKIRNCKKVGMKVSLFHLEESISQAKLLDLIGKINLDESIHGLIVQLPLPSHIKEKKIILAIDPKKDVDGFHPLNLGKMILGEKTFLPATAYGILQLLKAYQIPIKGKQVVIVGRSLIVGRPLSILLSNKDFGNATVTLTHGATEDLAKHTKEADILIMAIGKANFLKAHMVKKEAAVIDVGINKIPDLYSPKGYKLVGDVDFAEVLERVSFISPVPGGVGPMTCVVLLENTLQALEEKEERQRII